MAVVHPVNAIVKAATWSKFTHNVCNCSRPDYEVFGAGIGQMVSLIARRADFPLRRPVAMTEAAAA